MRRTNQLNEEMEPKKCTFDFCRSRSNLHYLTKNDNFDFIKMVKEIKINMFCRACINQMEMDDALISLRGVNDKFDVTAVVLPRRDFMIRPPVVLTRWTHVIPAPVIPF